MFYLTTHSTHFIYGYMKSDIWLRTILIVRKETRCCHIGYSFRLAARVLLYLHQDSTYHDLFTPVVEHWLEREIAQWVHPMKDRSDNPLHHERTLYLCNLTDHQSEMFKILNIIHWNPVHLWHGVKWAEPPSDPATPPIPHDGILEMNKIQHSSFSCPG